MSCLMSFIIVTIGSTVKRVFYVYNTHLYLYEMRININVGDACLCVHVLKKKIGFSIYFQKPIFVDNFNLVSQ